MILGFSTQLNGKPTHFVEKIWKGLKENLSKELHALHEAQMTQEELTKPYEVDGEVYPLIKAKLHTIREDRKDRWEKGNKIDFFMNVRKKNMFRFAPVLPVVSTQEVLITYEYDFYSEVTRPTLWIDGILFYDTVKRCDFGMLKLSRNDGFDTIEDFFKYFSADFKGKIIHWTDKIY